MSRRMFLPALLGLAAAFVTAQQKNAPKPLETDFPYLLEAQKLIPTDVQPASRSTSKDGQTITVSGVTSSARTPLPEPIFLFSPGQINAADFELVHFEVANGKREWTKNRPEQSNSDEPEEILRLTLRPVGEGLIRIEAAEMLNPGEYALIAKGQKTAFCFTVF